MLRKDTTSGPARTRQLGRMLYGMRARRPTAGRRALSASRGEGTARVQSATFELRFFDLDEIPRSDAAIDELMEDFETGNARLTPRLCALRADLESRYPWPQESGRVRAITVSGVPLAGGRCLVANLGRQAATSNDLTGIYAAAARHWVAVYDPQAGTLTLSNGRQDVTRRATVPE